MIFRRRYTRARLLLNVDLQAVTTRTARDHLQILTRGDEHWIYYLATNERWGSRKWDARLALAKLRLDGFFYLEAGQKPGVVETKPFEVVGNRLQVNVDATEGEVRVEVLDSGGKPLPPFSGGRSKAYRGIDELRLEPEWVEQEGLSALKGQQIRLRFHLDNARLYSFEVTKVAD